MSFVLKLIFVCTFFYLLDLSTAGTEEPKVDQAVIQEIESKALDSDEHFNCIRNCNKTEDLPKTCDEAIAKNNKKDGIYLLNVLPNELKPFYVRCKRKQYDKKGLSWLLIQRREDGSVNFYRNWFDYKYGFGNLMQEFWIGLERLHQMTKAKDYKLWIQFYDFANNEYNVYYSRFAISSEEDRYKLTVGGFSGNTRDSLGGQNGKRFSTFDNDNGELYQDCPDVRKSGWWHHNCADANLNGPYFSASNRKGLFNRIYWLMKDGFSNSLQYVQMGIRPI